MPLVVENKTDHTLALNEFIDFCRHDLSQYDMDETLENAGQLKALCNNKRFFADFLTDQLKHPDEFQSNNTYTPPVFVLHIDERFAVRVVVWLPESDLSPFQLLSYREPHDHDFSFLTCGLFGSGYQTETYEYDGLSYQGLMDEAIEITPRKTYQLSPGKLMYYRANRDIHSQIPPADFSASLNYILLGEKTRRMQFYFDIKKQCIKNPIDQYPVSSAMLSIAPLIGNEDTVDVLVTLASKHVSAQTRLRAWYAAARLSPENSNLFLQHASRDDEPYVPGRLSQLLND
ncbi:cupin domain-containing protein [Endozoicomonas numazuensis]|uniref:hypothetical protein n=1 Tax=Endozoicomonas numazuensis TaxID=1137799 RepID=UPI00068A9391|nr:hypothetical protein [Endozoicomonas numazuensis]